MATFAAARVAFSNSLALKPGEVTRSCVMVSRTSDGMTTLTRMHEHTYAAQRMPPR
jgi:hypothetical protein